MTRREARRLAELTGSWPGTGEQYRPPTPGPARPAASAGRPAAAPAPAPASAPRPARPARRSPQLLSLSVPQVGIVSALGLATIAAPLTGLLASTPVKSPNAVVRTSMAGAPAFPQLAQGPNAVEDLRLVPGANLNSVPAGLAAPRTVLVGRVSRDSQRAVLPGCDGLVPVTRVSNGALPAADLCTLWDGKRKLRADAAVALAKLNIAYHKRFGNDMCVSDGYRTLARQYAVKEARGGYAATPGTSEHGYGIAVDLCDGVTSSSSAAYWWLRNNAAAYGWYNPHWALPGGGGPHEPWHWQYLPGEQSLGIAPN